MSARAMLFYIVRVDTTPPQDVGVFPKRGDAETDMRRMLVEQGIKLEQLAIEERQGEPHPAWSQAPQGGA